MAKKMISDSKKCCFIGHRTIEDKEILNNVIYEYVERLILHENVKIFYFGSRGDFNRLCHEVVTDLKEKYNFIRRICYNCKSEAVILESERELWDKILSTDDKERGTVLYMEDEAEYKNKQTAGRASYIERNQAMIDDSDICIFYFNENYKPESRKYSERNVCYYQPKSGTAISFKYAKRKNKNIYNFYDLLFKSK